MLSRWFCVPLILVEIFPLVVGNSSFRHLSVFVGPSLIPFSPVVGTFFVQTSMRIQSEFTTSHPSARRRVSPRESASPGS
jgi:hypothetical protein